MQITEGSWAAIVSSWGAHVDLPAVGAVVLARRRRPFADSAATAASLPPSTVWHPWPAHLPLTLPLVLRPARRALFTIIGASANSAPALSPCSISRRR